MELSRRDIKRFWSKVLVLGDNGCWIWTGSKLRGYGLFSLNGKTRQAHRISWMLANGREPLPKMDICHTCDNPSCINPAHLWEGTRAQNIKDAWEKGRLGTPNPHNPAIRRYKKGNWRTLDLPGLREYTTGN